jgi:hypothetical protein
MGLGWKFPGTAHTMTGIPPDMDCKHFRHLHLAYLDDTLPGTQMAAAQRHVLHCDACAAHDTLVRRSLMIARSMPTIEPTAAFQRKLRERLAMCREEYGDPRMTPIPESRRPRSTRALAVVAASAVLGALAYQGWRGARMTAMSPPPMMALDAQPAQPTGLPVLIGGLSIFGVPTATAFRPTVGYMPVSVKLTTTELHGNRTETPRNAISGY